MGTGRRAITCAPHTMPISSPSAARASQAPRFCRALVIVSVFIRALKCHFNVRGVNDPRQPEGRAFGGDREGGSFPARRARMDPGYIKPVFTPSQPSRRRPFPRIDVDEM